MTSSLDVKVAVTVGTVAPAVEYHTAGKPSCWRMPFSSSEGSRPPLENAVDVQAPRPMEIILSASCHDLARVPKENPSIPAVLASVNRCGSTIVRVSSKDLLVSVPINVLPIGVFFDQPKDIVPREIVVGEGVIDAAHQREILSGIHGPPVG